MAKKKCYNCGIIDSPSANIKTDGSRKLVWEIGMKDMNGLLMHLIYCRSCGTVNVYKPGWIGNIKFDQFLKYEILLDKIKKGESEPDMLGVITPRIQQAMIEDGILPEAYFKVQKKYDELHEIIRAIFRTKIFSLSSVPAITELDELFEEWTKLIFSEDGKDEATKIADMLEYVISLYSSDAQKIERVPSVQIGGTLEEVRKGHADWNSEFEALRCRELQEKLQKHWKYAGNVRGRLNPHFPDGFVNQCHEIGKCRYKILRQREPYSGTLTPAWSLTG